MQMSISPTTEKAKDTYKKMTIPLGLKLAIKHYFFTIIYCQPRKSLTVDTTILAL